MRIDLQIFWSLEHEFFDICKSQKKWMEKTAALELLFMHETCLATILNFTSLFSARLYNSFSSHFLIVWLTQFSLITKVALGSLSYFLILLAKFFAIAPLPSPFQRSF